MEAHNVRTCHWTLYMDTKYLSDAVIVWWKLEQSSFFVFKMRVKKETPD